jgi:hypothetical protein
MISEKQLEANRNNAQLSHGPVTDAGRKRSSMNALRHGLTGQVTTMTDDDRTAHEKFSKALIQDLAPKGAMETQLAQRIATDSWRLNRMSAVEDNLFALGLHEHGGKLNLEHEQIDAALTTAAVFAGTARPYPRNGLAQTSTLGQQLQLLTLYEQRINRSLQKNLAMLQQLQATRKTAEEAAMKEASTLLKLSEMRGMEYTPAKDGFVFSTAEIHAAIDRQLRLDRAATTDFTRYKPRKFQTQAA